MYTHTFEQASVITDIVVLYLIKGRDFYREKKYDHAIKPKKTHVSHAGSSAVRAPINNECTGVQNPHRYTYA